MLGRGESSEQKVEKKCWCNKTGLSLNANQIISCCKGVTGEINGRLDNVGNVLVNNILVQRWIIVQEQKCDDRKTVRTAQDEITVGTEHKRSDEWKRK